MGFGMRLGDGGRGVDDKSRISCGFGILFSIISNLLFDSSLQNFFFISNKIYWYKRDTLVHKECTREKKSNTKITKV